MKKLLAVSVMGALLALGCGETSVKKSSTSVGPGKTSMESKTPTGSHTAETSKSDTAVKEKESKSGTGGLEAPPAKTQPSKPPKS